MEPTIKNDSFVLVSGIPYLFSKPKVNDIVAFRYEGKIFIKRIKAINKDKFFLTGDNSNDSLDSKKIGLIDKENIIGKVIKIFNL